MTTQESHAPGHGEQTGHGVSTHGVEPRGAGVRITPEMRHHLKHAAEHTCHMLSEQGPLSFTFVHNNTLLGLQTRHFEEAITEAGRVLEARGYFSNEEYRRWYARGRITDEDINVGMKSRATLSPAEDEVVATAQGRSIKAGEVYRAHLLHGIDPMNQDLLRYESEENGVTQSFRQDVPNEARASVLKKSAEELSESLNRVGRDWTMAEWMKAHTCLDMPGYLHARVLQQLSDRDGHHAANGRHGTVESCLQALGVPADRHDSYLACIDRHFKTGPQPEQEYLAQIRGLWLNEEVAMVKTIAYRHWGISGTMSAMKEYFGADPERYAIPALWHACLTAHGLHDPLSPSNPYHLREQDPDGALVESLSSQFRHMGQWGGPPIPLTLELRNAIGTVVTRELERLRTPTEASDAAADLECAHLCWIVLHDLGERHLNRRGFEGLEALLSLTEGDEAESGDHLLDQLRQGDPRHRRLEFVKESLAEAMRSFEHGRTHSDFFQQMTGGNIVETVNRYMIRICSIFMDEALAAWHMPGRALGFYDAWRTLAEHDHTFDFDDLTTWRDALHHLPTLAEDAVIHHLEVLGIEEEHWEEYLGRILTGLRGWAAMSFWMGLNPWYPKQKVQPMDVVEYLAVRLFYETLLVSKLCKTTWQISARVTSLRHYFEIHPSEFFVRRELFLGHLPEYLASEARALVAERSDTNGDEPEHWKAVADKIWMAREVLEPRRRVSETVWRLFHLAQVLGLSAGDIHAMSEQDRSRLLATVDAFPESVQSPVWLIASEVHYRDVILNALSLNRGRGRWATRARRPKAQVSFCIDEREEAIHRHFEELDPEYETLGAAGFYGLPMDYTGLGEHHSTKLCPQPVTPGHQILEVPRPEEVHTSFPVHQRRARWLEVFHDAYWETKRNLVSSYFLIDLVGFIMALPLIGRVLFRNKFNAAMKAGRQMMVPPTNTQLTITRAEETESHGHGHHGGKPIGFTEDEQVDKLEALLRNVGLTYQFARFVVLAGHGSFSMNNPHENAHDCGACNGKHGGPNARSVAAIANRPVIRSRLRDRGIDIPDDTWFVGSDHNTCSEDIEYYDLQDIPATHQEEWQRLRDDLTEAATRSAHERCRRFGSAPKDSSLNKAFHHIQGRAMDISQVRPEWGHATNAFAVVGRRSVTQGVFLDRRGFVISYDPTQDPTGKIVERILLAVGPVGAGINLEYYFSTVDPVRYGSDTKVPHNVTGLVGVMAGAHSDLRTGLPLQMTEIHEPMRLHLIVEASMAILGEIYGRQPGIQELLNGQWVHLISMDPDTGDFNMFVPGVGFELWDKPLSPIPEVKTSSDWYRGKYECYVSPAFITEPVEHWTVSTRGSHVN